MIKIKLPNGMRTRTEKVHRINITITQVRKKIDTTIKEIAKMGVGVATIVEGRGNNAKIVLGRNLQPMRL